MHRDVKPSNLIFERESGSRSGGGESAKQHSRRRIRILDFGLARLEGQESLTVTGDLVGTPLYMSPEQARRHRISIDHRTDIYNLGATLYELLTGQPPFLGKDHHDTLSRIIERDPVEPRKSNPRIPSDLQTIILKCLRKDPADRYGTAEALGQDLRRFVRGDPIEARPQSAFEVALRRIWRHRWRGVAALVVLALVVTVSLLVLTSMHQERQRRAAAYEPKVRDALHTMRFTQLAGRGARRHELGLLPWRFSIVPAEFSSREGLEEARVVLQQSVEELTEAIGLDPDRADAYWHRARGHVLLGDEDAALKDLQKM